MYEDPISQLPPHYGSHHQHISHDPQQQLYMHRLDQESSDQELHRLHQHQTLIQLRLEVNALRTQIQQLELLKQQLIHQKQFMQPEEYDQLMDQFSRTTASLLRVANPSHFSNGRCNERSIELISSGGGGGGGEGNGGNGGGEPYIGMQMMERLQEKLRNMTIQQHEHQQQQSARRQQELQHQHQQSQVMDASMDTEPSGAMSPRRDPVRMERMSLEADLRDLEQRMRSIQLLR